MADKEIISSIEKLISTTEQVDICIKLRITELFNSLKIGINFNQYAILETIYHNDGLYQRELSKLILKERSMIARTLNKLEKLGFIEILIGTKRNRLVKNVFITQNGKNIIENNQMKIKNIFSMFLSSSSEDDLTNLIFLLNKLKNSLKIN